MHVWKVNTDKSTQHHLNQDIQEFNWTIREEKNIHYNINNFKSFLPKWTWFVDKLQLLIEYILCLLLQISYNSVIEMTTDPSFFIRFFFISRKIQFNCCVCLRIGFHKNHSFWQKSQSFHSIGFFFIQFELLIFGAIWGLIYLWVLLKNQFTLFCIWIFERKSVYLDFQSGFLVF